MTDLRTAAQQALADLKDLHTNHNITYAGTIWRLEAALAQEQAEPDHETRAELAGQQVVQLAEERDHYRRMWQQAQQAEQTWVCPDSPEHRYKKPGHCEDCGKTLVLAQEQVEPVQEHEDWCASVTQLLLSYPPQKAPCNCKKKQAESAYKTYPIRMNFEWVDGRWLFDGNPIDSGEWCVTLGDGGWMIYPAPPKLVPLTQEEIIDATEHIDTSRDGYFIDIARAIERAHGIGNTP